MGTHTPGPWEASDDVILCGDPGMAIGTAFPCDRDESKYGTGFKYGEISKANALLIASAPELLEALKAAMAFIDSHAADPDITFEMAEKYAALQAANPEAAIAKATGGES